jgi:tetratricopeptide (TPR) repeat protein
MGSPGLPVAVQKNLLAGFRHVETTLHSKEGHFFIGGTPRGEPGVWTVILPDSEIVQIEPGVLDLFALGLRPSSVRSLLESFRDDRIYETSTGNTKVWLENRELRLRFQYEHLPNQEFDVSFDHSNTEGLIKWLSLHSGTRRNSLCPCNSGDKFRNCCALQNFLRIDVNKLADEASISGRLRETPTELEWITELEHEDLMVYIDIATSDPSQLKESEYWLDLGVTVGTLGYTEHSIKCLDRALSIDPGNPDILVNKAASLNQIGDHEDALSIMESVPIGTGRRSVILANILSSKGDFTDAIPLYEQAISEEPNFWLPYARLIPILDDEDHPLLGYWVDQAVKNVSKSPWIAFYYASLLWREQRIEELASADWINDVEAYIDESVIGLDDGVYPLTRAKARHRLAQAMLQPTSELARSISNELTDSDPEWHLCEESKTLAFLCANEGYPEFIPSLYERVCQVCKDERIANVPKSVEPLLIAAHVSSQQYEKAIKLAEPVLAMNPNDSDVLHAYYWSLDEVGRTEEAIDTAKRLYQIEPNRLHLAHNLGLMSERTGRFGEAKHYYHEQVNTEPLIYSQGGLTFISLLERNFCESETHFEKWLDMAIGLTFGLDESNVPEEASPGESLAIVPNAQIMPAESTLDSSDKELQTDATNVVNSHVEAFYDLLKFAKGNTQSYTYTQDLIQLNNQLGEYRVGPISALRTEPYSINQILEQGGHNDEPALSNTRFYLQLEQHGDFSVFYVSLSEQIPLFDRLPWEAKASILEGERRLFAETPMLDHSTVAVSFAKAVEISLLKLVFEPYKSHCDARINVTQEIELAQQKQESQATNLFKFLDKGLHLELGSMAHLFRLCNGRTARKEFLIGQLLEFLENHLGARGLLESDIVGWISSIARDFRNPGAHAEVLTREQAQECRRICISVLQKMEPCLALVTDSRSDPS